MRYLHSLVPGAVIVWSFLSPRVSEALAFENTFAGLVEFIVGYINLLIPLTITLAVLYYMRNILGGLWKLHDGKVDADWQKSMAWGIFVIALMVSIWGLLNILAATFQIQVG